MNLVERYIFRRMFEFAAIALAILTLVILTTQLLNHIGFLVESRQSFLTLVTLALMLVPTVLVAIAPFAFLVGAIVILDAMNADSELAVIEAAGAGPATYIRPVFLLAALTAALCFVVSVWVEPLANRKVRDIAATANADLVRAAVRAGEFKEIEDGLFISVDSFGAEGELLGVFIVDRRTSERTSYIHARSGQLAPVKGGGFLLLTNGEMQSDSEPGKLSSIRFQTLSLDLFTYRGRMGVNYSPRQYHTGDLLALDPASAEPGFPPDKVAKEINRRFTDWLYPLAFAPLLIVFGGGARSMRSRQRILLLGAALSGFLVRGVGYLALDGSGQSTLAAIFAYAIPIGAFALFSAFAFGDGRSLRFGRWRRLPASYSGGETAAPSAPRLSRRGVDQPVAAADGG